jgi:hypothetical protein
MPPSSTPHPLERRERYCGGGPVKEFGNGHPTLASLPFPAGRVYVRFPLDPGRGLNGRPR